MRKLKCSDCGGTLSVSVNDDGMALGTCAYCHAEYLLDRQRKQYVIVEHRYSPPDSGALTSPSAPSAVGRRLILGLLGGAAALAVISSPFISLLTRRSGGDSGDTDPGARIVFNVGSQGSGPGQFREYPAWVGIDALGQAVVLDNDGRIHVFDPDGGFIANFPKVTEASWQVVLLPVGDLILYNSGPRQFIRFDPDSGTVTAREDIIGNGQYDMPYISGFATSDGGFAVYEERRSDQDYDTNLSLPLLDAIVFYGADLREKRRLVDLISKAVAPDQMVQKRPRVTSFVVNGAGSIFISLKTAEDEDSRGGIYEFNADGVFQRRIVVEQGIAGDLVLSPDGSLWYGDAWLRILQRIIGSDVQRLDLSAVAYQGEENIGNVAAIATYPNGDIGIATYGYQLVRVSPTAA